MGRPTPALPTTPATEAMAGGTLAMAGAAAAMEWTAADPVAAAKHPAADLEAGVIRAAAAKEPLRLGI